MSDTKTLIDFVSGCKNISYILSDKDTIEKIPEILGENFCVIDLKHDDSPLAPFMELLRFYNPPFKMLEEQVYSPQLETVSTFIHNGEAADRTDLLLDYELSYEQKKLHIAAAHLIESCNNGSNYIFQNAQLLTCDSIKIIELLEASQQLNGKFIFCFDGATPEISRKSLIGFIKKYSKKENFLNSFRVHTEKGHDLEPSVEFSYDNYLTSLKNSVSFLDIEKALQLAVYGAKNYKDFSISKTQERILCFEVARAFYICGEQDKAALFFNNLVDAQLDDEIDLHCKLYLSKIYNAKNLLALSQKYAGLIIKKLNWNKKSWIYSIALMMDYYSTKRTEKVLLEQKYKAACKSLEDNELYNNYLNTALSFPSSIFNEDSNQKIFESILEKCDRISSQIGNQQQIATVLHWQSILYSSTGKNDLATKALEKADLIRMEFGSIDSIIKTKNGLAFHYIKVARFKEAFNLLNELAEQLFKIDDYSLVLELIKNMTLAAFYYHDFEAAEKLINVLIELQQNFIYEKFLTNPFLPELNDVLAYQTVLDIFNMNFVHVELNYNILSAPEARLTENCIPMVLYIKACILAKDNKFEESKNTFEQAINKFKELKIYVHAIVFFTYEYSNLLNKLGLEKESAEYFERGCNIAKENSLSYFFKNKKVYTLPEYLHDLKLLTEVKINLDMLRDKASKDFIINQLHNKINDYQFINKINSHNLTINTLKSYLEKVSRDICEFLMTQAVCFAEMEDGKNWKNISSFAQTSTTTMNLPDSVWSELNEKYGSQDKLDLIYDNDTELYYCDLSRFDYSCAIVIVPANQSDENKTSKITSSNLQILSMALTNIQSQAIIIRQNENLAKYAMNDSVTGLPDQQSLFRYLSLESEKIERLNKRKNVVIQKAIAFVDVDNFKYYNERFGRQAGDFLLKSFAQLLKKTLRRIDNVYRYNGDVFVIVMSDTSNAEGERMCQRIYLELSKQDFFIPELKKFVNQDFSIPSDKSIGFSMGMCSNLDIDEPFSLTEVLRKADKALKYAKRNGKGTVSNWAKIKELM